MAPRAPRQLRRLIGITGCLAAACALSFTAQAEAEGPAASSSTSPGSLEVSSAVEQSLVHALRGRVPAALQGRIQPAGDADGNAGWATLPAELDGRVRLGNPKQPDSIGRAGWKMLDVPGLDRISLARGAAYVGDEWDLLQSVDEDRLREYIVVREHQGMKTWSWKLFTSAPGISPKVTKDGRIDLGGGWHIEPPKLLGADLAPLGQQVKWTLRGDVLSLRFDDSRLALPYIIDPDATPPIASFVQWAEGTNPQFQHYNPANSIQKLWYNPNESGNAVATINATDPESAVQHVTWPNPPAGWTPAGGNDSSATSASGLVATYWDNSQLNTYPGTNFTGLNFTRLDPNVDFDWGSGTPYAALGVDTFSVRWTGKLEAPETGTYYFQTRSDDGVRLWVNGVEMASRWDDHGPTEYTGCVGGISLVAGTKYDVKMEFYENGGGAVAQMRWRKPSDTGLRTPTDCYTTASPPRTHATTFTAGTASYPTVPASAFTTGGGSYTRTFSWSGTAPATTTVNATATNTDGATTGALPFTFAADDAKPVLSSGSVDIQTTGWGVNGNNRIDFPAVGNFSDAGSSAPGVGALTRTVERRDGVANGTGGCDTSLGSWTIVATNPTGTSIVNGAVSIPAPGTCSEFSYKVVDEVGNALRVSASGYRGWDAALPDVTVSSIVEGTNPQWQKVVGNDYIYVNTNETGDFTVTAVPTDDASGVASIRWYAPGTNWSPAANVDVPDPGPWTQTFSWTTGASSPGTEPIRVYDNAGRTAAPYPMTFTRDITAPNGGTLAYGANNTWYDTLSVPVDMTATMTDTQSGVASYQLQREETTLTGGTCDPLTGIYSNLGAPVLGDPPPALGAVPDTTVVSGMCYRYRVEAVDHVGNIGYRTVNSTVRVDDEDPVVTLDPQPASGSGTLNLTGTVSDMISGPLRVEARYEDQSNIGVFTTINVDTGFTPGWAINWNTSALDGNFKLYIDIIDRAGNEVLGGVVHDILLDNSPPTLVFDGFVEGTNPQCQFVDPFDDTIAWVNDSFPCDGDILATFTPEDLQSGIDFITTPAGPAGWTPAATSQVANPGPYVQSYAWTTGSTNFGTRNATATSLGGRTSSNTPFNITEDHTAPTGGTFGYGANGTWYDTLSVPVDMSAARTDTQSGVASYQLQREETPLSGTTCDPLTGVYTNLGLPVLGNPAPAIGLVPDTTVVDGMCYRYRVESTDNVGNISYLAPNSTIRVDDSDPTVTLNALPAAGSGNILVGGTAADTLSGPDEVAVRIEDQSNIGTFTEIYRDTSVGPNWGNYTWNTTALNGNFKVYIDVIDNAGNEVLGAVVHDILLDNSPPTMTFDGFVEGTNPACQWVDPLDDTIAFFNNASGCDGDITATFTPDDPESGIDYITLPATTTNWTPLASTQVNNPGPYVQSFAWTSGAANFGTRNATATSNGGRTSANTPFTITRDTTNPTGGNISYPTGWTTANPITITVNSDYTDTQSGIYQQRLMRDETPITSSNCGNGEPWPGTFPTMIAETVAGDPNQTLPATIDDASVVTGMCYRYRLVATDNVTNSTGTTTAPTATRTDYVSPIATIDPTPADPWRGTETLTGTSDDGLVPPASNATNVYIRWENLDDLTTGVVGTDTSPVPLWARSWDTTLVPDGNYRIHIDVDDNAGNLVTDAATRDVLIDNSPPVISLVSFTEGSEPDCQHWDGLPSVTFYYNRAVPGCTGSDFTVEVAASDPPGTLVDVDFPANTNIHPTLTGPGVFYSDTTSPYTANYTYNNVVGNAAGEIIYAHATSAAGHQNSAPNTPLNVDMVLDNSGPTGLAAFDPPGTTSSPTWWSNQNPIVTFDTTGGIDPTIGAYPGSGIRANGQQIFRRQTTGANCVGGWQATWTQVGVTGEVSPFTDSTTVENECYQYRVGVYDNTNNPGWMQDTSQRVRIDTTNPTGTFNVPPVVAPNFVKGTSVSLTGTAADSGGSGVASIQVQLGAGPGVACTPAVAASWACTWDTTTAPDGPTTLTLVITDNAGNVLDTLTQPVVVDNEKPSGTVVLAEGTNPQWQFLVPGPTPRMYVNTDEAGDLTAEVTPFTDTVSGPNAASFPALGAGWTPAVGAVTAPGPYVRTYAWTGPAADPGTNIVALTDLAGNDNLPTGLPFEVVADVTDPTGGSLTYDGGPTTNPTFTFSEGTDAGSGIQSWQGQRRQTTVIGPGACDTGSWTAWGDIGPANIPGPTASDASVTLGNCYQYRLVVTDNVGNQVILVDPEDDTVTVEPAGIVIAETGAGPSTDVTEGGATDTYDVTLRTIPAGNVTITLGTPDGQVSTSTTTLSFTPANWNVAQTVTVTAVDDDVDENPDPHTGQITHVAASPGNPDYDGLVGGDVIAQVTDDDTAGITVSPDSTSVDVNEAGATSDTYTIVLDSEPIANVDIAIGNVDGQVAPTPPTLTFTSANWNTPQTVTVNAVDDAIDEAPTHPGIVTHAVTSADLLYSPITLADVTATVTDNDTSGVTVTPTTGLALDEADVPTTTSYTVVLDTEPLDDVTITVVDDGQSTPDLTSLVFTSANWNLPQTVTMTVVDDLVVEGAHTSVVSHLATSVGDAAYGLVAVDPVTIDIADNDVPGIEVTPLGPLTATEGGTGSTYDIHLKSQPTADVVISFNTGSQLDPVADYTFTAVNWNVDQTVAVNAIDDDIDESTPHPGAIVHTVTSADLNYNAWSLADMDVAIDDDDTAGITIDELGGVEVDEAAVLLTDTFTVVLDTEPVADVTVTVTPDAQITTTGPLTFTTANWNVPQIVTVTAVDDPIDEGGPHPGVISITAAGDPLYDPLTRSVTANVLDDDVSGVTVSPGTLALDETLPASDTYTVVLDSQPAADVVVAVTPDAQVATTDTSLTFTTGNWATPQTVTVEAVDDDLVEISPHPGQLTHSITSVDPVYAVIIPAAKDAAITDNDVAGVTIDELGGVTATEGGATGSYTVVLDAQPAMDVVVTLTDDTQVDGAPTPLTFTTANWDTPQTVTATAVDDSIQEPAHTGTITHAVASADPLWAAVTTAPDVIVDIIDDDIANIIVTSSSPYSLSEDTPATTASYDVVLATEPSADVTIDLTVPGDVNADVISLTFTSANWSTPQTVTVNAIDDLVYELPTPVHTRLITHAVVTGDLFYAAVTVADQQFDITDNDIPGISVDKTAQAVTEGGATDTFSVVLDTQPTADVTITLTGTQVGFDVNPLVFTTANWATPQAVVVNAIDDDIDEDDPHPGLITFAVASPDTTYAAFTPSDITVDVTDNDNAGVTVAPGTATPLTVDEATPGTATYTIVLDSEPTADVDVAIATTDGQTTTDLPTVTFTSVTWSTPQTVTVTAVDDSIDEADPHTGLVTHAVSSADPKYAPAMVVEDQPVEITDDDTAAVTVTPTSGLALDEAAVTTATFDVVLATQPLMDVDITLDTSDLQTTTDVPTLTFTPANWATVQTVTVSVVDDAIAEGSPHTGTIVTTLASGDVLYGAIDPDDVTADITDDDTAGITVTETAGSTDVDEDALTDTYDIVLTSQPTDDVVITITGGPDASVDKPTVTFTALDWMTPQVITVSGTPDALVEGLHTQLFTHSAASTDPNYAGATITDVTANVTDDDLPGATITPSAAPMVVTEDGATSTYDVVLDAEPTADVTITIAPDAQVTTSDISLLFTAANWNVPQTVTVTAVDDLVTEPSPHPGIVLHTMASADLDFNAVAVSDVTVDITDNDIPGVTVTPTALSVTEGGAGSSFDVVLDSVPGADVTISFTEPGQLDPMGNVTFTPANWNTPQTITVNAFQDFIMEGAHSTTITLDTSSAAPAYDTGMLTIADVAVDIADDDFAGVLLAPATGLTGAEGGPNVPYAMSLTSEPTDTITITLAGDADGAPTTTAYTFTPGDWATPQPVDVAIVEDLIDEGAHTTTITGTIAAGTDAFYGVVTVDDQVIDITDNDVAGVTFTPVLPGPLAIAEGGATATYDVVLDTEPTGDVTIDVTALGGQATVDTPPLTFTTLDWMTPQTVTVTADDDPVAETTPHFDSLTHVAGGADPTYAGLTLGDMDLAIDDNDVPGVLINATIPDTSVVEGGLGDTVEVVLASQPTADVEVTLTGVQVTVSPNPLTFTSANWNTPQVVTVDAIDDDIFEGPHTGTIDAITGSPDPFYVAVLATQHTVLITDNDTAGVVITQPAVDTLDEADVATTQTYQVRLESEPIADVDVTIATADLQTSAAPTTLTFTPANWNVDQDVVVTVVDDAVAEADPHPGVVTHDTASTDPAYGIGTLTIDTVTFQITDNDTPGILITPTTGHLVTEGGATSTYDIVLLSQPTADVVFTPVSTQLEWSVADVTFTTGNWATPQTITLQAIDDLVDEADPHPGTLDMAIASADAGYTALTPDTVTADITDNDTSDLVITPATGLAVDEDGALPTASYVLTLTSIPSDPVTVTLTPDAQVGTSAPTVVLDNTNWNIGVSVDVTAVDDDVAEDSPHPGTITHAMASLDPNFDAESGPDEVVDITDNDVAGVTITESGPDTTVAEDGSITDDYTIELTSEPTADVTITITPDSQVAATPLTYTFDATNWSTPQTVPVTAVDDFIIEGAHQGTFTHAASSADLKYDGAAVTIADVVANVLDDDVAGVVVTPAGGTFEVAEGGAGDTLSITLTSEPLAPVTIDVTTPDLQTTATPSPIVLDATNWNTGVDVTVDAVDDGFIETSPHAGNVQFGIDPGSDPDYLAVIIPDAIADIADNDSASVTVDVLDGISLDEAAVATTDTFEVSLGASPNPGDSVDVAIAFDALQLDAAPTPLTFDDTNWNVPQVVTVTVVDDAIDEANPHTSAISFTTTSVDTNFNALTVADVDATIADDDDAGMVVDTTTIALDETGPTSSVVNVHLASEPLGTVEVAITPDAQVTAAPAGPLTFDNTNWNIDQAITIEAIDDLDDEASPHPGITTLTASSVAAADPTYDLLTPVDVTADITDNDTSGVTITLASGTDVDEATPATTMVYDVVLDTHPSGNVDVTFTPDAQLELVGAGTLTFTPADWNTPQQVEIRAFDDPIDEASPHPGLLAVSMGGLDPLYAALTPAGLSVDVLDDDTAGVTITQTPAPGLLAEDGSLPAATYDVVLDTQPALDVDVTLAPDAQVDTGAVTTLTFTPANWNTPQQVSVTAVDDAVTEPTPHTGLVAHTTDSLDPAYALAATLVVADATFDITDDDVAGFHFDPVAPTPAVDEADVATTATYDLYIDTIPSSDVIVDFDDTNDDVTVSPAQHTFTSANYATPVTITVTAVDDFLVENAHTDLVTSTMAPGSDPTYLAIPAPAIPDVSVAVADDDVAELIVDELGGVTLDEADVATPDTFTIALAAEPTADVDVAIGTADGQTLVDLPTITFTPLDWMNPQTITVTVIDDPFTETTPHDGLITFTTTSADTDFAGLVTTDVAAQIADDDVPGITITDPADFTMDEADVAGTERIVHVELDTSPASPVTINVTADAQLGLQSLPAITLDGTNWNTGVDVVVRAIDDAVDETSPHDGILSFAVDPGSDAAYVPLTVTDRTFQITDDDTAGIVFTPVLPGPLAITEGGATATYDVVLESEPTADVTITIAAAAGQATAAPSPLTFTSADWATPQTVTVTATDDAIDEGPHTESLTHTVGGADALYGAMTPGTMDLDITDNDTAGITMTQVPAPGLLAEDGSLPAATYTVVLDSEPTADVTVTLTADTQVDPGATTALTFTAADWNTAQTVTVNAVDDGITETSPHAGTITHLAASADLKYDAAPVTDASFDITDDDIAGFHYDPVAPTPAVDEADVATTQSYDLYIDTEPAGPVTVDFAAAGLNATVAPLSHTFTSANWTTPVTLTVTVVDDALVEGPHTETIQHVINPSSDVAYLVAVPPADVSVAIADDDVATVEIDDLGGIALDENDVPTTDTFNVTLGAEPTADVDVAIATTDLQTSVDLPTLTFTPANWNVPQVVTVTVVDDAFVETTPHAGEITFTTTSVDTNFNALTTAPLNADITDNDNPGFAITDPADFTMDEADVATTERTMDMALTSSPATPVIINVVNDSQLDAPSLTTLTFDNTNWNVPQPFTIRALDDGIVETTPHDGVLSFTIDGTSDATYTPLSIAPRTFQISDDDTAGITVTPAAPGPIAITEGGTNGTYSIVLDAIPATDVTVTMDTPDGQSTVGATTLTFTSATWNVPQDVNVNAVDDLIAEGSPHAGVITHVVAGDPLWTSITLADMNLDITDNDNAGVTITQVGAPQAIDEAGALPAATYTVELDTEPTADVVVAMTVDTQVLASPSTLTFTSANWNAPQTVSVTAFDDTITELDPHTGTITHATTSADPAYDTAAALVITDATFTITDDDAAGFTITPAAPVTLSLDEADDATTASYDVTIDTDPLTPVVIDLAHGADVTVSPATLTFAPGDAGVAKTVTVTVVNDGLVEGAHTDTITHAMNPTSDPSYLALLAPAVPDVTVDIADDDIAAVIVDEGDGLSVAEAGQTTDTFTVKLGAEPTADVDVNVIFDSGQMEAPTPGTLTFTPTDWMTPQTVTVQPLDDALVEGPHTSPLSFSSSSADLAFDSLVTADVDVAIDDDDIPGVVVTEPADLTMDEADAAGTERIINVHLETQPVGVVTITAANNGQVLFQAAPILNFDSSNWNVDQQLVVRALDDAVAEASPHDGIVSYTIAAPADPGYPVLAVAPTTFQVTDDDLANALIECQPGTDWVVDGGGRLAMSEDTAAADHDVECQIQLGTDAAQDVVIDVTTTPGSALTAAPASITIPGGSAGPVPITFTATDDAIAQGPHTARIDFAVSSVDPIYDPLTIAGVDVDIADNDAANVTIAPAGPFTLTEGGTSETFTVVLDSEPTGGVDVGVLGDAQVGATPGTLKFLPSDWNVPQTVTITAVDDAIDEPDGHPGVVSFTFTSGDPFYSAAVAANVDVSINDNDTPGVIVTTTDGGNAVTEGGATDTFSVQLGTQPSGNVTVAAAGDAQVGAAPAALTFTPANWNTAQTVTLTAVQDIIVEGEHQGNVAFALDSTDVSYLAGSASTPAAQPVTITDDDVAGIAVVESDGKTLLTEAGVTDTYTVALLAQPTADVTINVDGGAQVTPTPATLTFTPANWNTAQTVTATAVQDSIDEVDPHPGEIKHVIVTTAPGWADANVASVTASITDDDTAEIIVGQSDDVTKVVEGAPTGDTVTFRLSSEPSSDVSIVPKGDEQLKVSDAPLVLNSKNWRDPISLPVAAVDDDIDEGDHQGMLSFEVSSKDPGYAKATINTIVVAIVDNDVDKGGIDDGDDDEDETTDRKPRAVVPPATTRPSTNRNKNGTKTRRSGSGAGRTGAGRTRLPDGLDSAGKAKEPGVRTGKRLGGEVVAAKEEEASKKQGPIAKAMSWLGDNWKLWVPLLAAGLVIAGTLSYMLRKDPVKSAQRAAGRAGSRGASASKKSRHLHSARRKKDDDEDEDPPNSGGRRRR
jgi:hypothetical protein